MSMPHVGHEGASTVLTEGVTGGPGWAFPGSFTDLPSHGVNVFFSPDGVPGFK